VHEFTLAQGLMAQLQELAREHHAKRVTAVKVAIGPFSGIVVDSFRFGFECISSESDLTRGASLEIETVAPTFMCCSCDKKFEAQSCYAGRCPHCNGDNVIPFGGNELILLQVEMEE